LPLNKWHALSLGGIGGVAVGENSNEMESVQADEVREIGKGAGKLQDVGNCHKKVAKSGSRKMFTHR